jgi:predicted metal-dependent hydrolase
MYFLKRETSYGQLILVVSIVALCFYLYYNTNYKPQLVWITASFDKNNYLVLNKPDKQDAAELFAKLATSLNEFVEYLTIRFPEDNRTNLLKTRFISKNIREAVPQKNQTSYSINKGEKIVLCIRTRDKDDKIVDFNTIMFVALHELSHICTISIGHKTEFWENFKWVLANAIQSKTYTHVNYKTQPADYCKIKITDNPLSLGDMSKYVVMES